VVKVSWGNGSAVFPNMKAAERAIFEGWPDAVIRSDVDLVTGKEKILVWASEEDAENGDGSKSVAGICTVTCQDSNHPSPA